MPRLFIAANVPVGVRSAIARVQECLPSDGVKPIDPAKAHLTLKFLGAVDEDEVGPLVQSLSRIRHPPCEIVLDSVRTIPGPNRPRVLMLAGHSAGFASLAAAIDAATPSHERDKPAMVHVTIARFKRKVRLPPIELRSFGFTVESFALVDSRLTPQGPIYREVAEFELG